MWAYARRSLRRRRRFLDSEVQRVSVDTEQLSRISGAEKDWRAASTADEQESTARTAKAEQDAFDVYAQLCDEAQICLLPSCFVHSPARAWCLEHGAK